MKTHCQRDILCVQGCSLFLISLCLLLEQDHMPIATIFRRPSKTWGRSRNSEWNDSKTLTVLFLNIDVPKHWSFLRYHKSEIKKVHDWLKMLGYIWPYIPRLVLNGIQILFRPQPNSANPRLDEEIVAISFRPSFLLAPTGGGLILWLRPG